MSYKVAHNTVVTKGLPAHLPPEVKRGSFVRVDGDLYIIVRVMEDKLALCNLRDGNRYSCERTDIYDLVTDALGRPPTLLDIVQEGETITITVGK